MRACPPKECTYCSCQASSRPGCLLRSEFSLNCRTHPMWCIFHYCMHNCQTYRSKQLAKWIYGNRYSVIRCPNYCPEIFTVQLKVTLEISHVAAVILRLEDTISYVLSLWNLEKQLISTPLYVDNRE